MNQLPGPDRRPRQTRSAQFRFYEELNDFLPERLHKIAFPYTFTGTPSIKDAIEAIGPPHTAVDLIVINGESVDFNRRLHGGERVAVYPVFESLDITPLIRLRPKPLRNTRFIVDVNLGKLAQKLRLLGFDTLYRNDYADSEIAAKSVADARIILTRDKGVLKHGVVTHGYWVRQNDPKEQIREVTRCFQLETSFKPFTRCIVCNGILKPVDKAHVQDRAPPNSWLVCDHFAECAGCGKLFWRGSHYHRFLDSIADLKSAVESDPQ